MMHKRKVAVATGLTVLGVGLFALRADAHHPTYSESCTNISVSGADYPSGSHVLFQVDGTTILNQNFSPNFSSSLNWDQTKSHTWVFVVTSPDGVGQINWTGTQPACVHPTTTTTRPAPTTTVPPSTTVPPGTTIPPTTVPAPTTTVPVLPTTVVPPPTTPAPVPTTVAPVPTTHAPVSTTVPLNGALPATGAASDLLAAAGVASVLTGLALLLAGRRPKEA